MRQRLLRVAGIALVVALSVGAAFFQLRSRTVRLACTADTSICIHPSEQNYNHGGKSRLRVKGNEHILLMKFDLEPLKGRGVKGARLMFRPSGEVRLKTMGLSTVTADWREGRSSGPAAKGEVTFLEAAHGQRKWIHWNEDKRSTFLSVSFGRGKSKAWYRDVQQEPDGWLSVEVPPELIRAIRSGLSHGLALSDEKGQTRWNNDIFSREQSGKGPYLAVTTSPWQKFIGPEKVQFEAVAVAGGGHDFFKAAPSAQFRWSEAAGLRYQVLSPWAQVNPASGRWLFDDPQPVMTDKSGAIRLHAARNWFGGFQVAVESGGAGHTVELTDLRDDQGRKLRGRRGVWPVWYVKGKTAGQWWPDPLLADNSPSPNVGIASPRCRASYVEIYVAHDAGPGIYTGNVEIRRRGTEPVRLPVKVEVHKATLPDELGFKLSLNTYGSPGGKHGRRVPSKEFVAEELAWHRMAHQHRATIAVVPYSQSGQVAEGMAPKVSVGGAGRVKVDWSAWDRRWEPYFTGRAFKGLPRDGQPIDHFYLPMHENWPLPIEKHYKWAGDFDTHWKRAGAIEDGFPEKYTKAWTAVSREFARHVAESKWTATEFQCYLNNKYSFKQSGRGSSYWLLDEPMHRDDYLALKFFGELFRSGVKAAGSPGNVVYRVDLSRPQWDRNYLSEVTDLCICNAWPDWPEETMWYRRVWSYGTTPGPDRPLSEVWRWTIQAFAAGCDGQVPWQTIGRQDSWTVPEATSVIYPSRPGMPQGPVASLRLKALRAAQQDIELARLLMARRKWTDRDMKQQRHRFFSGRVVEPQAYGPIRGINRGDEAAPDDPPKAPPAKEGEQKHERRWLKKVDFRNATAAQIVWLRRSIFEELDK